jgi:hypothetical protein
MDSPEAIRVKIFVPGCACAVYTLQANSTCTYINQTPLSMRIDKYDIDVS